MMATSNSPFTINNLPYGIISTKQNPERRQAVAYQDYAIDVKQLAASGQFNNITGLPQDTLSKTSWNAFAALPPGVRASFRSTLQSWLKDNANFNDRTIYSPLSEVTMHLPMHCHNYSDFYCSHEHAKNCSAVFNLPFTASSGSSWFHLPQVYNGRTSSLAVSGHPITRPCGIFPLSPGAPPSFQPEQKLDFELEMGIWVSNPLPRGQRLDIAKAKEHIFGITLLNDWSSRCIQFYEIQPLGPFHSKGSLTSISPWIVPIEALDEFAGCARHSAQEPAPMPHLSWNGRLDQATWDVHVEAKLVRDGKEYTLSQSNLNELHWTPLQQITHLASAGEGLSPGDVFGTGTISSSRTNEKGEKVGLSCIWERQLEDGRSSSLPDDLHETLLKDGDEVVMTACVKGKDGKVLFGFGECRGKVLPAVES